MAVWQYPLQVIPVEGLLRRFEAIPDSLTIDLAAWKNHWDKINKTGNMDISPDFEDALTIQWWKKIEIDLQHIEHRIDRLVAKASYSKPGMLQWKGVCDDFNDHDVLLLNDGAEILTFSFRTDVRDRQLDFLAGMAALCQELDTMLMNDQGKLLRPHMPEIARDMLQSNAAKFVENPEGYLNKNEHLYL